MHDLMLRQIRDLGQGDHRTMAGYLLNVWVKPYGAAVHRGGWLVLHTGGWSENEDIVAVLQETEFWRRCWARSERGGHYWFQIPKSDRKRKVK